MIYDYVLMKATSLEWGEWNIFLMIINYYMDRDGLNYKVMYGLEEYFTLS